jgi:5-methyltetrahydrofolate--homocysteine methyltransferase
MAAGLDLPIINPNDSAMMDKVYAFNVLYNYDKGSKSYIEKYGETDLKKESKKQVNLSEIDLAELVIKGLKENAASATKELLKTKSELQIVNEYLIPALDMVGNDFEKGIIFLPQLIQSAETVKSSFDILKESLKSKEKILLRLLTNHVYVILNEVKDLIFIGNMRFFGYTSE